MERPTRFTFRPVHQGWNSFGIATIRRLDGGEIDRALEHHGEAAGVLPYDEQRRCVILICQDRVGPMYWNEVEQLIEIPAGGLDGKDAEAAAIEEAYEEAGVCLRDLELIVHAFSMPSVSSERIWLFLSPYTRGDCTGIGGGVAKDGEVISIKEVGFSELSALISSGSIRDAKTLILVQALMLRKPHLFRDL